MIDIDISFESGAWEAALPDCIGRTTKIVRHALQDGLKARAKSVNINGEISIVLADDDFIHHLNKTWRGKDNPTNVLSFPQTEIREFDAENTYIAFGDIIMAYETLMREAQEQRKSLADHFAHLLVHGTLHLMHFDHETDKDAQEMETLEIEILKQLSIKNPYEII